VAGKASKRWAREKQREREICALQGRAEGREHLEDEQGGRRRGGGGGEVLADPLHSPLR